MKVLLSLLFTLTVMFANKQDLRFIDIGYMYDYPNKTCVKNTHEEKVYVMEQYSNRDVFVDDRKISDKGTLTVLYGRLNGQELFLFMFSSMEACIIFAK